MNTPDARREIVVKGCPFCGHPPGLNHDGTAAQCDFHVGWQPLAEWQRREGIGSAYRYALLASQPPEPAPNVCEKCGYVGPLVTHPGCNYQAGHLNPWPPAPAAASEEVYPKLRSTDPALTPAAKEAFAAFGFALLPKWWDDGNPGDIDGGNAQDAAEAAGLWHRVERHADGVECEWCNNEGPCGELTEAGLAALAARGGGR